MKHSPRFQIWSFVGLLFIIYGILIFGKGIYYIFWPPTSIALYKLNASLWWGGLLFIVGIIFLFFDIRRKK